MNKLLRPVAALLGTLTGFARRRPLLFTFVVLGLALTVGGGLVFREMQARTKRTLEYATSQINQALATKDMALLATYVDLEAIAAQFAANLARTPGLVPSPKADAKASTTRPKLQETVLESLNGVLKGAEVKESSAAKERSRFLNYLEYKGPVFEDMKPPPVLPGDLLAQMVGRPFTVQAQDGEMGILSTPVEHPGAGISTRLRLLASNSPTGWKVREMANTQELLDLYKKSFDDFNSRREAVFHALNARIREVMSAHCYIILCDVVVDGIMPDGTVKVIVHIDGTNIGKNTLLTAGIRIRLFDAEGGELAEVPIGINNRIPVGTSFRQYYNLELNWPPELVARIKPLQKLRAAWDITAISLDNRLFLFPKPLSELTGNPS